MKIKTNVEFLKKSVLVMLVFLGFTGCQKEKEIVSPSISSDSTVGRNKNDKKNLDSLESELNALSLVLADKTFPANANNPYDYMGLYHNQVTNLIMSNATVLLKSCNNDDITKIFEINRPNIICLDKVESTRKIQEYILQLNSDPNSFPLLQKTSNEQLVKEFLNQKLNGYNNFFEWSNITDYYSIIDNSTQFNNMDDMDKLVFKKMFSRLNNTNETNYLKTIDYLAKVEDLILNKSSKFKDTKMLLTGLSVARYSTYYWLSNPDFGWNKLTNNARGGEVGAILGGDACSAIGGFFTGGPFGAAMGWFWGSAAIVIDKVCDPN